MSLTVSAYAPHLLGGLQPGDPAVTDATGFATGWTWWRALIERRPETRLLVVESEGALLAVLARHLGWDGVGQLVVLAQMAEWRLQAYDGPHGLVWQAYLSPFQGISTDPGRLHALAAAVVQHARLARALDEAGTAILPDGVTVADVEDEHGLPALEVLP